MKIARIRSDVVRVPDVEPLANGQTTPGATRDIVVTKITTADGIEGLGVYVLRRRADQRAESRRR